MPVAVSVLCGWVDCTLRNIHTHNANLSSKCKLERLLKEDTRLHNIQTAGERNGKVTANTTKGILNLTSQTYTQTK